MSWAGYAGRSTPLGARPACVCARPTVCRAGQRVIREQITLKEQRIRDLEEDLQVEAMRMCGKPRQLGGLR